ncbi:MAG: hypothetical protein GWP19_03095 [Planctomycetia bacterium]|nr:hypothetical protein [Planctomycetia bacterium]
MTYKKTTQQFKNYLTRADKLLKIGDNISICYCALELRKAIELIVWTQFLSAFQDIINYKTRYSFYDFIFSTQSQSISKMYDMLKKYVPNYVQEANNETVTGYLESFGNAPLNKTGKSCFIHTELPNSDYRYLSEIIHYEKEFLPQNYNIDRDKLRKIYKRLVFIQENYTFHLVPTEPGKEEDIIKEIETKFNLKIF